ncbi:MAG: hypothetical protein QOE70_2488 [Chthoniobacter sp.]|nr:hypothetical protein [Chthoniobacter sp.]
MVLMVATCVMTPDEVYRADSSRHKIAIGEVNLTLRSLLSPELWTSMSTASTTSRVTSTPAAFSRAASLRLRSRGINGSAVPCIMKIGAASFVTHVTGPAFRASSSFCSLRRPADGQRSIRHRCAGSLDGRSAVGIRADRRLHRASSSAFSSAVSVPLRNFMRRSRRRLRSVVWASVCRLGRRWHRSRRRPSRTARNRRRHKW